MDIHVLQICLTTWFITMLGFTSDPRTNDNVRLIIQVINVLGAFFIIAPLMYLKIIK